MLLRRGSSYIRSGGHASILSGGFIHGKLLLSQSRPNGGRGLGLGLGSSESSGISLRVPRGLRPLSTGGAEDQESPQDTALHESGRCSSSLPPSASTFVDEGRPHRHPSLLDHQTGFPATDLGRFETEDTDVAVPGGDGQRGARTFNGPSSSIGFFLFGDEGASSGKSDDRDRGNMSSVGVIQNGDEAHEASIAPAAAHDSRGVNEDGVGSAVLRSDGEGGGGMEDLSSPSTRSTPPSSRNNNASGGRGGVGDAKAHKMWIAGRDKTVSELDWKEKGTARDDTAVIEFHSQKQVHDPRFQGYGVLIEDKDEDIRTLVDSFTAPALAAALRDRETALHSCAHLIEKGDLEGVRRALLPFTAAQVAKSRREMGSLDLDPEGFTKTHMFVFRKVLQRLPRHVTTHTETRASVMVPLCNVDGVASVLFTKRSDGLRAHSNEVCFPGGKVEIGVDEHIIQTALREMGEEIGIQESSVDVLGVLRCDWAEVASLVGVAVTPVVGFLGNISREQMHPNPDEVSHCFTIPIRYLIQQERWRMEKYKAPEFIGGPYAIWGLTGYILHRLVNDVLRKHVVFE